MEQLKCFSHSSAVDTERLLSHVEQILLSFTKCTKDNQPTNTHFARNTWARYKVLNCCVLHPARHMHCSIRVFILTLVSMVDFVSSVHNKKKGTMVNIVSSPRGTLSPQQALKLANVYLENASTCIPDDRDIALVLCHDAEMSLSQAKKSIRRPEDQYMNMEIATAYMDLGNLLESQGHLNEATASYKKAEKLE